MTRFDRLSWWCSWLAPAGIGIAVAALLLETLAGLRGVDPGGWRSAMPAIALVAGGVGVLAHLLVLNHSAQAGSFPSTRQRERSRAEAALRFGQYREWRALMRGQHPELQRAQRAAPRDES